MRSLPQSLQSDALSRWGLVREAFERHGLDLSVLGSQADLIQRALVFSDFLTREIVHRPDLLRDLLQNGDLGAGGGPETVRGRLHALWMRLFQHSPPEKTAVVSKESLMQALRQFRRREMVRIALRDICGWAGLERTLADLSALADVCLATALDCLQQCKNEEWGLPQNSDGKPVRMVVLALGKLGAKELNFSSDVDLIFAYPAEGQTLGGSRGATSNEDYFIRLSRELIQVISASTADGFVFRVDTRLRPYGDAGPLVMSFDRMEDYYVEQGRGWERYALIKARTVAGDLAAGERLLERLKPFVFRRYLDYGAFDGLREMKGRIAMEVRNKGLKDNVKLGPGGIREIEFFGQMFQMIRGGVEADLQVRPIRQVLALLVQKGYIPVRVGQAMDEAYCFLRTTENRLQQWDDHQVHQLPADALARLRLAAAMGFDDWESFKQQLESHRHSVHHHFEQLLAQGDEAADTDPQKEMLRQIQGVWHGVTDLSSARRMVMHLGYQAPDAVLHQIAALREDRSLQALSQVGRERLNRLVPLVIQAVSRSEQPDLVLGRIFDLIRSIQRRTSYLALMLENPSILTHLVALTAVSPWIASFLSRHPVLLDELLDPRTLFRPPQRAVLEAELAQRLRGIASGDLEYQMETLRVFKQVNVLRVAASDITSVMPLMKVSDHLSDIAEVVLNAVVDMTYRQLAEKYGMPACGLEHQECERGFVVIAYGKLGGLELGYGSDLDLVFLHAAEAGQTSGEARSLDNAQFFSRLGQRVLHMLTTHTGAGQLYDVDMRLRPSGDSGMLVSHVQGYAEYQRSQAWTWEHQALIRARAIIGDPVLRQQFEAIRLETLTRRRDKDQLAHEVADIRERLRKQHQQGARGFFDIKQDAGGIVDIEFLVQYLVLRHAYHHPAIARWTDNVRLIQALNESRILDEDTAFALRRAYLIYRAVAHRLNLRQEPVKVAHAQFGPLRRFVIQTWNRFLSPPRILLPDDCID